MKFPALLLTLGLSALSAQAGTLTVTNTATQNTALNPFTVASGDLLETSAAVDSSRTSDPSAFQFESSVGVSTLTDGSFGPSGDRSSNDGQSATAGTNAVLTYQLDLSGHSAGYDIAGITTYAGWSTGRYGQAYNLSVLYVGDTTFTSIANVAYGPASGDAGYPDSASQVGTKVALTGLLTGVSEIQFSFAEAPGNPSENFSGYREIDVFAPAQVPEPSTYALMGMGLVSLVMAVRSRRTANQV